jgi:hypothetical protein
MMGLRSVGPETNRFIDRHGQRCLLRALNERSSSRAAYLLCFILRSRDFLCDILRTGHAGQRFS